MAKNPRDRSSFQNWPFGQNFWPQRPDAPPTAQPRLLNHSPDSGWGGDRTCYAGGPLYRSGTRPIGGNRLRSRKSPQDSGDLVLRSPKVNRVWSTFGVDQFTLFIPFHKDMYKFYMSCHFWTSNHHPPSNLPALVGTHDLQPLNGPSIRIGRRHLVSLLSANRTTLVLALALHPAILTEEFAAFVCQGVSGHHETNGALGFLGFLTRFAWDQKNLDSRTTEGTVIYCLHRLHPFTIYNRFFGLPFRSMAKSGAKRSAEAHLCRNPGLIIPSRRPVNRRFRPRLMTQLDCPQGTPVAAAILEPLILDLCDVIGRPQARWELGHGTSIPELLVQIHKLHQIPHIKGTHQQGGRICIFTTVSLRGPVANWRYHIGKGVGIVPAPGIIVKVDLPKRIIVDDAWAIDLPELGSPIEGLGGHIPPIDLRTSSSCMGQTQVRHRDEIISILGSNSCGAGEMWAASLWGHKKPQKAVLVFVTWKNEGLHYNFETYPCGPLSQHFVGQPMVFLPA